MRARVLQSHGVEVHATEDLSGARQLESYFLGKADGVDGLHCARYLRLFDFGNYIVDVHRSAAHPQEAAAEIAESSPVRRRGTEIAPNTLSSERRKYFLLTLHGDLARSFLKLNSS